MQIARVDAATNVVVNIEIADQAWLDELQEAPGPHLFIPYTEADQVSLGAVWDGISWPEREPLPPPPVLGEAP